MRFLICGLGSIGRRHLQLVRSRFPGDVPLVLRRAETFGDDTSEAEVVFSLDQAIAGKPQAAIIATPAPFHVEAARRLLEAQITCLIEKPLSHQLSVLSPALPETAPARVAYCLRFHPVVRCVMDNLAKVGRPQSLRLRVGQHLSQWRPGSDWRSGVSARKDLGGGVLRELSHEIDLALLIARQFGLGDRPGVQAELTKGGPLGLEVEEAASLLLDFDGMRAGVDLDFHADPPVRLGAVEGTYGSLHWDMISCRVAFTDPSGVTKALSLPEGDMYADQLEDFLGLIGGGTSGAADLSEATAVLRIIEAAEASGVKGPIKETP
ncbi:MAG: Gfo/Idh/MocA family protein [Magnetovibrionaceae bacterium]